MKKFITLLVASLALQSIEAQSFIQAYQDRANMVTQTNITANLQAFANLGVKTTGSQANANALTWLKDQYTSYGYSASQMAEDSFPMETEHQKIWSLPKPAHYTLILL